MASREAFDSLMTEYQHKVYRLAYSLLGNQALAEEAAQETFLRVWKSLDDFRGESSPSTWIYSIARNTCLTLRKTHARPFIPPRPDEPPHPQGAGAPLDWDRAIAELPEKHRQVVLLYFMQEKSYEEVSQMLDLPIGTVKTYLHRAKKQLAILLLQSKIEVR